MNLGRTVACDGISLRVPSDWNVAVLKSQPESGYLRLDDDHMSRLEIKWAHPAPGALGELPKLKRRYIASLRRAAKKSRSELVIEDETESLGRKDKRAKNFLSFRWRASQQGHTLISGCNACGRQVVAQLYAPLSADLGKTADAVFSTFRDHSPDHWRTWSIYDFLFKVPSDFQLLSQSFLLGRLELAFQRGQEKLVFSQWAVAQSHLGERPLPEWFRAHLLSRARGFRLETDEAPFRNHSALWIQGEQVGLKSVLRVLSGIWGKKRPSLRLYWRLWQCPRVNRIFSIQGILLSTNSGLLDEVATEVKCH